MELMTTTRKGRTAGLPFITRVGLVGINFNTTAAVMMQDVLGQSQHVQVFADEEQVALMPCPTDAEAARRVQFIKGTTAARLNARPLAEVLKPGARYSVERVESDGVIGVGFVLGTITEPEPDTAEE